MYGRADGMPSFQLTVAVRAENTGSTQYNPQRVCFVEHVATAYSHGLTELKTVYYTHVVIQHPEDRFSTFFWSLTVCHAFLHFLLPLTVTSLPVFLQTSRYIFVSNIVH